MNKTDSGNQVSGMSCLDFILAMSSVAKPEEFFELRLIRKFDDGIGAKIIQKFIRVADLENDWAEFEDEVRALNAEGFNIFYSPNTRIREKGKAEDVEGYDRVWADVDFKDVPEEDARALVDKISGSAPPTLVINTGHGLHCVFFLSERADSADGRAMCLALSNFFNSDHVQDASRVLRLPTTKNMKREPYDDCVVESYNEEAVYTAESFRSFFEEFWPEPKKEKVGTLLPEPTITEMPKSLDGLGVSKKMQSLIENGWKGVKETYRSRSEADMAVLTAMVRSGCSESVIEEVFDKFPIGDKHREEKKKGNSGYLKRSMEKASAKVAAESATCKTESENEKRSQADELVKLALSEDVLLFHSATGEAFAYMRVGDRFDSIPCRSKRFGDMLQLLAYKQHGSTVSSEGLNRAVRLLSVKASVEGPRVDLSLRVARKGDAILYDLCDVEGTAIKIEPGKAETVTPSEPIFRRHDHQGEQTLPEKGGRLEELFELTNISDSGQKLVLKVWLVTALIPGIAHPLLVVHGCAGSAKTFLMRLLHKLVDPASPEVQSFSKEHRAFIISLAQFYFAGFDNVFKISQEVSDRLCRSVTGDGIVDRQYHTNDDPLIHTFQRVVVVTGINNVALAPDLLERAITINLEAIPDGRRREEAEIIAEFEAMRPRLFGAMVETLAQALKIFPSVRLPSLPRMADFARYGFAIAQAMGHRGEEFLEAYAANGVLRNEHVLDENRVAKAIVELVEECPSRTYTATELYKELARKAEAGHYDGKGWPGAPHIMGREINVVSSNLEACGIHIKRGRGSSGTTYDIVKSDDSGATSATADIVGATLPVFPDSTAQDAQTGMAASPLLGGTGGTGGSIIGIHKDWALEYEGCFAILLEQGVPEAEARQQALQRASTWAAMREEDGHDQRQN